MSRNRLCRLVLVAVMPWLGACASGDRRGSLPGDAGADGAPSIDERVEELLRRMTLDEKLAQLGGTGIDGMWRAPGVPRLGIPGFAMSDGPRGLWATQVASANPQKATAFPVGMARGATWDEDLERRVGDAIGEEARAWGANVLLAPVVNVLRHPAWGRAQETYGEDPTHLGKMASAFVRGAERHVISDAKHFAANDIEDTRFSVSVNTDERTLREVFLEPFRMTVEAGVSSVMSAYNRVNGTYCSENTHLLGDVLKDEWGFRGFVVSDWVLAVRSTAPSLNAGLDLEMPTANFFTPANLGAALDAGETTLAAVDDAVRRLVRAKLELEVRLDPAVPSLDVVGGPAHAALAREVAQKSIVLLKNEGNVLPLVASQLASIAVVGTYAGLARLGDNGSSSVTPAHASTPLDGIRSHAGAAIVQHIDADVLTAQDVTAVSAASVAIVVVGLGPNDEGENLPNLSGGDRDTLSLSPAHEALIQQVSAANPRTVVVMEAGSALTTEAWRGGVPAIVMAWYPGQEGGDAIADVLFGDVNPSGRLPLTFPVDASQLPAFDHTSAEVTYGYLHGYRHVERQGLTPAFPFGFGLGYTTFALANLVLSSTSLAPTETLRAVVDVTNSGARAGDHVVQLYVGVAGSAVERPVHDLKAFARVHLEAGETKSVSLDVPARSLAIYDVGQGAFRVESLRYTAFVGSSVADLPVQQDFDVR